MKKYKKFFRKLTFIMVLLTIKINTMHTNHNKQYENYINEMPRQEVQRPPQTHEEAVSINPANSISLPSMFNNHKFSGKLTSIRDLGILDEENPKSTPSFARITGKKRKREHEENKKSLEQRDKERLKYFDEELPKRRKIKNIYVASKDVLPYGPNKQNGKSLFECTHCYILQKYNMRNWRQARTKAHLKEHLAECHGIAVNGKKRKVDYSLMNKIAQKRGAFAYKKPLNSNENNMWPKQKPKPRKSKFVTQGHMKFIDIVGYQCNYCGKKFKNSSKRPGEHLRINHPEKLK